MLALVRICGVLFAAGGAAILLHPALLHGAVELMHEGNRLWLAVAARFAVGALLLASASLCRTPRAVMALGALFLVSGLGGVLLGLDGMRHLLAWIDRVPEAGLRLWALVPLGLGALLLHAASGQPRFAERQSAPRSQGGKG